MRHAGAAALDELEPVLRQVRSMTGLTEKKRGTFYRGSKAFLHFHEDPTGPYADVRLGAEFERCRVRTAAERRTLRRRIADALS